MQFSRRIRTYLFTSTQVKLLIPVNISLQNIN